MLKKYIAKTSLSISVLLNNGNSTHISFEDQTGGGSIYYTDDTEMQSALKKHRKYGKLFREDTSFIQMQDSTSKKSETMDKAGNTQPERLEFSNNDDAKDYLTERFGISRTKLMTRTAIENFCKKNNIAITWTE